MAFEDSERNAAVTDADVRPFRIEFRRRSSTTSAGAFARPGGPSGKPSRISRKACSSRRCRRSRATGRRTTTGAKCEAKLNALPQFITEIDGLDIHFIHVRSKHEDALPLIVTHGWPGSIIEQLKIIESADRSHGARRRAPRTRSTW